MLHTQILNLFIDGSNILVDLLLIPQTFGQCLRDKLINRMIFAVDLSQGLHLTGGMINMTNAEVIG